MSEAPRPRADLGQGKDRCLPQGPSDKLTSSLSGELIRGAEQLPLSGWARGNQNPESRDWGYGAEKGGAERPPLLPGTG